ncbi:MAG: bifunctional riboflavin kinase/FAD synthetase [Bdellovibrionales bacterium]|nr:bifunctional riboflavin kinase/FAD synthetase [Bdellovibrionales bacterium]
MQVWREFDPKAASGFPGAAVMIGNFDGLHRGHQSLLQAAGRCPGPRVVITFDPHPLQVLQPAKALKRLLPREDLAEQLPRYGVDLLILLKFDRSFAAQTAEEFLNTYVGAFTPKHIIAGYDFGFGKAREGSLQSLRLWSEARDAKLHVVQPMRIDGDIISSRRIRDLVTAGDVEHAALLLGRPFYLRGEVVAGAGRGQQIGVPTMNQHVQNETLPQQGAYATRTRLKGMTYPSVTNIGINPTFGGNEGVKVETHVLDATPYARGETIDVDFVHRLRPEMKFAGIEDLKQQIQKDILKAKQLLGVK